MTTLGSQVEFDCGNGGTVKIIEGGYGLKSFGVVDGWAFWDNLHINADVDMTMLVGDDYNLASVVQHLTGDTIIDFGLTSRQPNGTADIRVTGLKPNEWYRLRFDNILAQTESGVAHGQTTDDGILQFNGVNIPDGRR